MSPMTRMILSRLAQVPIILLAVYTLTFMLAWLIPGNITIHDPVDALSNHVLLEMLTEGFDRILRCKIECPLLPPKQLKQATTSRPRGFYQIVASGKGHQ